MLLVRLPLLSHTGAPGTESGASLLHDALWAHAGPQHALEHVRVRPLPTGLNVALFVRAENDDQAHRKASSLLTAVLGTGAGRAYRLSSQLTI
ncbi:hypothetical protein BX286_4171 [Streptomyces sp. 3211.6]|uniref:hypothetical protein n=1 Tax=Streptomyces TaxID=1883 RepID=UPI0009A54CB1|nr:MULTISPECIES: hypothetical protein [Streptomyces]RKT06133.1 hypothetical protein BX286_4171 [Streptomyces sp. 3211.6]RPF46327.1 hypothetical protein EDD96_2898 [Streptomyces sp. Ag109_G2-6]